MNRVKRFDEFIKTGVVRRMTPDLNRSNNLKLKSKNKFLLLKEKLEKINLTDKNAEDYIENCYDIIMISVRARMIEQGYNASGSGAHEAEVSYMANLGFDEIDIQFADKLRYFRNGMLYYGTSLDKAYAEKVLAFLDKFNRKIA